MKKRRQQNYKKDEINNKITHKITTGMIKYLWENVECKNAWM